MRGLLFTERYFHRGLVEGHRHIGSVPIGQNPVAVVAPLGKPSHVIERALVVGVEDMGTVAMYEDSRLVRLIVHVPADVRAFFDYQDAFFCPLGKFARNDATSEPAADHDGIDLVYIDVLEISVEHSHVHPFL